uniref:Secreted peptide n=1 Tax=Anopheles braziliensis TaxID=58242 RepID=A0A2M3ZM30_9DIPT
MFVVIVLLLLFCSAPVSISRLYPGRGKGSSQPSHSRLLMLNANSLAHRSLIFPLFLSLHYGRFGFFFSSFSLPLSLYTHNHPLSNDNVALTRSCFFTHCQ